jgi:hypothetical protein
MPLKPVRDPSEKISAGFHQRLAEGAGKARVRALVLLSPSAGKLDPVQAKVASPIPRAVIEALSKTGGHALAEGISPLFTVPVDVTIDGIRALAVLPEVRAIIEDQSLKLVR